MKTSDESEDFLDIESLCSRHLPTYKHKLTERDLSLYALSIGCTSHRHLRYLYEGHPAFSPVPLYALIAAHPCLKGLPLDHYMRNCDMSKGLHGEQYLELAGPLPTSGTLVTKAALLDVQDKGRAASVVVRTTTHDDQTGRLVATNEFTLFMLGAGGFKSNWTPPARPAAAVAANTPPARAPDAIASERIGADQAALYRLNGDLNPLHIDPAVAARVGFEAPILHGLCTLAVSVRLVAEAMRGSDLTALRRVKARFSKHVMLGDMLVVEMWRDGPDKVVFQTRTEERGGGSVITAAAVGFAPRAGAGSPPTSRL